MKWAPALAAVLLLTACSSDSGDSYSTYFRVVRQSLTTGFARQKVTLKQAAAVPYASMGWSLNGGNENLIVLATDNGHELMWTSAARIVLTTQNGRIRRTVGLPHDLVGLTSRSAGEMPPPALALQGPYSDQRTADFSSTYNVTLSCRGMAAGARMIKILGKSLRTLQVNESCECLSCEWRFTDNYWLDQKTGMVWRARQHINPQGDVIDSEILRPPG